MSEEVVYRCQEAEAPSARRPRKIGETLEAISKEPRTKHPTGQHPHTPQPDEPSEPPPPSEPEPEEDQPQDPSDNAAKTVSLTAKELEEALARIVTEARKPVLDERKLRQQIRMREHNRLMMADNLKMQQQKFFACNHMQLPGSVMTGCAVIAWATQSDNVRRGTCQHCGTVFSPIRAECASEEIWRAYNMLVRLPTHPSGNINNVFQSA